MFFDPEEFGSTVLYGIASYETKQCRRHGFPIVYTSIVDHYDWIKSVLDGKPEVRPMHSIPLNHDSHLVVFYQIQEGEE